MPYIGMFKTALGNSWRDIEGFRFDVDTEVVEAKLSAQVNATNPDLDAFHAHGGKILLTHGWADPVISPEGTIQYVQKLRQRYGASSDAFIRLYLVPGMAHCAGGPGPSLFDGLVQSPPGWRMEKYPATSRQWTAQGKETVTLRVSGKARV